MTPQPYDVTPSLTPARVAYDSSLSLKLDCLDAALSELRTISRSVRTVNGLLTDAPTGALFASLIGTTSNLARERLALIEEAGL